VQAFKSPGSMTGGSVGSSAADLDPGWDYGARFLQMQTLRSVLRNSFAIYGGNWRTISLTYAIAMLPIAMLHAVLLSAERVGLASIVSVVFMLSGMLMGAVVTVIISDLCLGLQPGVWRSYRRGFANAGKLIGTYLLAALISTGGLLLLLIPGIVWAIWYMFVVPVVVLEQSGGRAALRRSRALGKGCYLRNMGIVFLVALPLSLIIWLLAYAIASLVAPAIGSHTTSVMQGVEEILQTLVLSPLLSIPGTLLYYDMRARKDGYGAAQLAEDLQI
jgi:hypothetical protein